MCSSAALGHVEGAREVDGDDLVPVVVGHLADRSCRTVMPALLTRMSSRPCWSMTSCTVRRQSSARADVALVDRRRAPSLLRARRGRPRRARCRRSSRRRRRRPGGQAVADGGADAAGAAGDEGHAARRACRRRVLLGLGALRVCHGLPPSFGLAVRALARATPRGRARSRCAPSSRPSGRCARRRGRSA